MKRLLSSLRRAGALAAPACALLLLLAGAAFAQAIDTDGDGVADDIDLCPADSASPYDADGDGCVDATANARHVEFWDPADLPLRYVVHVEGAPGITNGSDFTAIQAGYAAWTNLPGVQLSATYEGTIPTAATSGLDGVHQVSFQDPEFLAIYGSAVLAVGLTTSFDAPTEFDGRLVRPGQIVDADMLFNPNRTFRTTNTGTGIDLVSVTTHEAGHLFGFSHSCVVSSTMFPALPGGNAARSLETDDRVLAFMGYPDAALLPVATALSGTVTDGDGGAPIGGAAVFAIAAATDDTLGGQFTLPDGTYRFVGLPAGDYYVTVHPLDGSLAIHGVVPGLINHVVEGSAGTLFVPEAWDLAESATDDGSARDPVTLAEGAPVTGVDIVTNVDATGPSLVEAVPADGATDVRADAVFVVEFDEALDFDTARTNFRFELVTQNGRQGLGGNLVLISEGTRLVFDPTGLLDYDAHYELTLRAGIADLFGNTLGADVVLAFDTEPAPPLAIDSIAPRYVAPGTVAVISGRSFDLSDPAANVVSFGGVEQPAQSVTATALVVVVPEGLPLQDVTVTVATPGGGTSNSLTATAVSGFETARGTPFDAVDLGSTPRALASLPDGVFTYAATDAGLSCVVTKTGLSDFLAAIPVPVAGGTVDVATTPDGTRAYAVSRVAHRLVVVNTDYGDAESRNATFNTVLDEVDTGDEPLGIAVGPDGRRVYVATAAATVQAWDVHPASATYNQVVGEIALPSTPTGRLAVDAAGSTLYVPTADGSLLAFDATTLAPSGSVAVGADPRDVALDPRGGALYVTLGDGDVAVVSPGQLARLATVTAPGSLRGIDLSPAGTFGLVANRGADRLEVINLDGASAGYLTVGSTFPAGNDPVDVAVSPDGLLVFAAEEGANRLSVLGVGYGPTITGITPTHGRPGDIVVLTGSFAAADTSLGFGAVGMWVDFDGTLVNMMVHDGQGEPYSSTGSHLWVRVPADYDGGPIRVVTTGPAVVGMPYVFWSNPVTFDAAPAPSRALNQAVFLGASSGYDWGAGVRQVVEASPAGDLLAAIDLGGTVYALDFDPDSPRYGQVLFASQVPGGAGFAYFAFAPDGKRLFVSFYQGPVFVVDTDPQSPFFGGFVGQVDFAPLGGEPFGAGMIAVHPSNDMLIVQNVVNDGFVFVHADPGAASGYLQAFASTGPLGFANDMAIHPSGKYLYFTATTGLVHVVSLDSFSPDYLTQVNVYGPSTETPPRTLDFSPDGHRAYVVTRGFGGAGDHRLEVIDTTSPATPQWVMNVPLALNSQPDDCVLRVSPNGQRAFCDIPSVGGLYLDITEAALVSGGYEITQIGLNGTGDRLGVAFSGDGDRLYSASRGDTGINVVEFYPAPKLDSLTGNNQIGVAGQALPAPIRLRVSDSSTGLPLARATAEVSVEGGGGNLSNGLQRRLMATDANGELAIDWTLGSGVDTDPQNPLNRLRVTFYSQFTVVDGIVAVAVADPGTLPLSLAQVLPADQSTDVSATTTVQATFSRAVDRASVDAASLVLRRDFDDAPVATVYGFADGDRRVSLIPLAALDPSTPYELYAGPTLADTGGGPLVNPGSTTFTTQAPPPLAIASISPPAATVGAEVVIAGQGFPLTPADNTVSFNGARAVVLAAQPGFLRAVVPLGATSGNVTVQAGNQTAGPLTFTVLVPTDNPLNEIVATAPTGVSIRSVAVLPDGSKAYTVATETDQVLPLDLETLSTLPPVAVGDQPLAAVSHPDGSTVYVVNYGSGTVSVIDTATDTVVKTIPVGNGPVDLVASPAGDRLYVVNQTDQTLTVIDIDSAHATYHTAVASVGTGSTTKGAAITPDGTLLILVTAGGEILIVDVSPDGGNAVVATVPSTTNTKGAAVSPDGTLLYVLLEDSDDILVYSLQVTGPVGVISSNNDALPLTIVITLVDTIAGGDDPQLLVFDPSGSGLALVVNGGQGGVTFLNSSSTPYDVVEADLLMEPRTLNLQSHGERVKATLTFPAGTSPRNVDLATVRLQGVIPPVPGTESVADRDGDGIEELELKFDRAAFQAIMPQGDRVPARVSGRLTFPDRVFTADDTIRTLRPTVVRPAGGDVLVVGTATVVSWISPERQTVTSVDVNWSADGGETWAPVALGVADVGSVPWTVPATQSDSCLVIVTLRDSRGEEKSSGMSAEFAVRATATAVAPPAVSSLDQNYPNSFNPRTTIRFALAREGRARLTIYDVAGRRVRQLVDAVLRPDVYRVEWDGTGDHGGPVASGVYLYRLETEGFVASRKMMLVR